MTTLMTLAEGFIIICYAVADTGNLEVKGQQIQTETTKDQPVQDGSMAKEQGE